MYWYTNHTRRMADDVEIPGVFFQAFIHNGAYYLTTINAYKDGMVDCWGLVSFEEFRNKVRDGWVVTSIPNGAEISIHHVGRFIASNVSIEGPEEEFVKDVENAIAELDDRPTAQERLADAIRQYPQLHSYELREQLRQAYRDLPAYRRKYFFGSRMERHIDIQEIIHSTE